MCVRGRGLVYVRSWVQSPMLDKKSRRRKWKEGGREDGKKETMTCFNLRIPIIFAGLHTERLSCFEILTKLLFGHCNDVHFPIV